MLSDCVPVAYPCVCLSEILVCVISQEEVTDCLKDLYGFITVTIR